MWIVYHVFPAVLAVSAGICLYISLCKLCETRTSWRRASALIAVLAALFMLDLCSVWTLFMMHLCVFLLLWLLARRLSSRRLCWGLPLSCLLAAAMILGGMANARDIHATRVTIENEQLDEDLRIAWLSDLHYPTSADAGALRQLVRRISDEQPDVIILGGDIVDEHTSAAQMEEAFDELGKLRSSLGIYYIYGNHDCARYSDQPAYSEEQLERAIARQGIEILCDERVLLRDDVMLVGRDDRTQAQGARAAAEELMGDEDVCHILLDHRPLQLAENAAAGYDLQLSGHTHDGQIFPIGTLCSLLGLNELEHGTLHADGFSAVVSSGAGTWGYPVRTQGISEYVVIDMKKAADA